MIQITANVLNSRRQRLTVPLAAGVVAIIVLVPFHALLTVWGSQLVGHYTLLRLWKELLLVPLTISVLYMLFRDRGLYSKVVNTKLTLAVVAYLIVLLVWGVVAYLTHHVGAKALGYGWIVNARLLVFLLDVWVISSVVPFPRALWPKLVFWPAVVVVGFGLLQYFVLPYDFLKHLGYSGATIFPYEDINHNTHYIRIFSTLRGANPLGAYLVVLIALLLSWRERGKWWRYTLAGGSVLALILTFSRSAWLGLGVSLLVLVWVVLRRRARRVLPVAALALFVAGLCVLLLRHNTTFQNIFLHTQANSAIKTTSDQGHASALRDGLHDMLHEPLGRGPGTAGPASAYNSGHPVRIAENYYIQLAQEIGWVGLSLFLAVNVLVASMLWQRRSNALALGLLAALAGVSVVNLLSHAWADDTLAYMWWGLAGMALASDIIKTKAEQKHGQEKASNQDALS